MSIPVEVISLADEIRELKPAWNRLCETVADPSMFMLWDWLDTMIDLGDQTLQFLRFGDPDAPCCLIPFMEGRFPLNKLLTTRGILLSMGHFGWPSQLDIPCVPGREDEVWKALIQWLDQRDWNFVALRRINHQSKFLHRGLLKLLEKFRVFPELETRAAAIMLPDTADEMQARLTKSFRKKLNKARRKLEKNFAVEYTMLEDPTLVEEVYGKLMELHLARISIKNEISDLASEEETLKFHRAFMDKALRSGNLRLSYVKLDGEYGVIRYDVRAGDTVFCYNIGMAPKFHKYSLGNIIHWKCLEHYIDEGVRVVNMLPDIDDYKFMWADHILTDDNVVLLRKGIRGKSYFYSSRLFRRLRRETRRQEYEAQSELREKMKSFYRMEIPL